MNSKIVKIVKIGSLIMTIAGTIGAAWAGDQENKATLAKLVAEHLGK